MPRLKQKHTHARQRQRLIDACISALHSYGPSRTTVEKVVAIAQLSPGIVRFYFASKAAMLVASLQFLATEFEEQVLAPVSRLKEKPVAALRLMVDLYLDPTIASPRKVSVWYAFWGEANSRQEYYDICGQKDEGFAALVRELIERLILKSGQSHLDADGIALGLIGVLEMLWQDFAFKEETDIDRPAAKARAMAYLRSVFPAQFAAARSAGLSSGRDAALAAWTYDSPRLYALEREHVLQNSWQFVALRGQLKTAGDFISSDLGFDRVLLLRGENGELRAFRNSCPVTPHVLLAPGSGRRTLISCPVHGLTFGLDGTTRDGGVDLLPWDLTQMGDLLLVRAANHASGPAGAADRWHELVMAPDARVMPSRRDRQIAADWKLVAELLIDSSGSLRQDGLSARLYQRLTTHPASAARSVFLTPNHCVSVRPDGWTMQQILPMGAGRCALREYRYTWCDAERTASAAQYLAQRFSGVTAAALGALAESIQRGMVALGHQPSQLRSAEMAAFHRRLRALLPVIGADEPTLAV